MSTLTPEQIRDLEAQMFAQIIIASPVNGDWPKMHTTAVNAVKNWIDKNGIEVVVPEVDSHKID